MKESKLLSFIFNTLKRFFKGQRGTNKLVDKSKDEKHLLSLNWFLLFYFHLIEYFSCISVLQTIKRS